jgi:hypothetical protein
VNEHRRQQHDTVTPIRVRVSVFDVDAGDFEDFTGVGWTLKFRMWRQGATGLVVDDEDATCPEDGVLDYAPTTEAAALTGRFLGAFVAIDDEDPAEAVVFPSFAIVISPVPGGAP